MTSDLTKTYFDNVISLDLFRLVADKKIGSGIAREVWSMSLNRDFVMKIESGAESFQNVAEWETWQKVKYTAYARWFAPCIKISSCGTILIQKRTSPVLKTMLPAKVPSFFTDLKKENWGMIGNRHVCHDYGITLLMEKGMTKRMQTAHWTEGSST